MTNETEDIVTYDVANPSRHCENHNAWMGLPHALTGNQKSFGHVVHTLLAQHRNRSLNHFTALFGFLSGLDGRVAANEER